MSLLFALHPSNPISLGSRSPHISEPHYALTLTSVRSVCCTVCRLHPPRLQICTLAKILVSGSNTVIQQDNEKQRFFGWGHLLFGRPLFSGCTVGLVHNKSFHAIRKAFRRKIISSLFYYVAERTY